MKFSYYVMRFLLSLFILALLLPQNKLDNIVAQYLKDIGLFNNYSEARFGTTLVTWTSVFLFLWVHIIILTLISFCIYLLMYYLLYCPLEY